MRILGGLRVQVREVALRRSLPKRSSSRARSALRRSTFVSLGAISKGLFVNQEDMFAATTSGVAADLCSSCVPLPGRSILVPETEVLFQCLLGLFQVVTGLGATGAF